MKQAFCQRRNAEHAHTGAAGRLSEDRHVVTVTAESRDVIANPFQGGNLVEESVVARNALVGFGGKSGMSEKAQGSETIVDRHQDDTPLGKAAAQPA